jgi:hypothetical protein
MATKTFNSAGDSLSVQARDTALFAVTGTYAGGPVAFLGSVDGGVTFPLPVYGYPGGQTPGVTQATLAANQSGQWFLDTRGLTHVMAKDLNGLGGAAATLLPTAAPFFRLSAQAAAGGAVAGNLVLSLPGGAELSHVNHGFFWPTVAGYDLGDGFLWEAWVKPGATVQNGFLVSDGYGGAHSLLWGFGGIPGPVTGNVWNGTTSISFGGGYVVAAGEWVHVALLWPKGNQYVYSFVNGVCDGQAAFAGPRVTPAPGGPGMLYVGGSDHLNLPMSIAALRGFDRGLPFNTNTTWGNAFRPPRRFNIDAQRSSAVGVRQPDFLADYTVPGVQIPDHSPAGCVSGSNWVPAPGTVTPTLASGGTLTASQAYFYKVTCVNQQGRGESTPSAEATATPTGATLTASLSWAAVAGADSYNVYRSTTTGTEVFLANTTTASYSDAGAVTPTAGVIPPVLNTTGYPTRHPGYLEDLGVLGAATNQQGPFIFGLSLDPKSSWVSDPGCPYGQAVGSPLPAEAVPAPAAVPVGALAFDSFGRANQTYAFQSAPTLGSTEGGSLGPLAWQTGTGVWGILQGAAVYLSSTASGVAWVNVGTADQDVRVTNRRGGFNTRSCGIAFRVQDALNFWYAFAYGDPGNSIVHYGTVVAGVMTETSTFNPGVTWDVLRVLASGTTITIYTDATQRVQLTAQTTLQTAMGAGLTNGNQGIYVHSLHRNRNWTVFQG